MAAFYLEIILADVTSNDFFMKHAKLSLKNENFSGSDTTLNGAIPLSGSTWTMGAMFASTSGLPLKTNSLSNISIAGQSTFYPTTVTLGDILLENGYHNEIIMGSDSEFGGRGLYCTVHGNYDILNYTYMNENHRLPYDNYVHGWGFDDQYLYQYAREELTTLSEEDSPFNLTLLTVDTHFEDGAECDLCIRNHPDNQYADVYECADRQIGEFIKWCQQQEWYANTTIVITGDHLTMDSGFCDNVDSDYVRKTMTLFINADAKNESENLYRTYSSMDLFPTTIASLGATIEGDRLGLGTNLFSSKKTLTEEIGIPKKILS